MRAFAVFEGRPDEKFPLRPKEIATKANDQTQTFRATFTMEAPTNFTVLPGMTTTVQLDLSELMSQEIVQACAGASSTGRQRPETPGLDSGPASMTVSAREVTSVA